jgi:hypothetical protein
LPPNLTQRARPQRERSLVHESECSTSATALQRFDSAIESRAQRAPESHVLLQDKSHPPVVIVRWDGYDAEAGHLLSVNESMAEALGEETFWFLLNIGEDDE